MNLKQYIRGRRRGKAARDLEKEALNDPFLNDAIDGYDAVPGDHSRHLENLHRKVSRSSLERADFRRLAGLVAGLLILFAVNFFFYRKEKVEMTAMDTTAGQAEAVWEDTGKSVETKIVPPLIAEAKEKETEQILRSDDEIKKAHNAPVIRQKNKEGVVEESLAMSTDVVSEDEVRLADAPKDEVKVMAMSNSPMSVVLSENPMALSESVIVKSSGLEPIVGWKEFRKYLKREMRLPADTCRNISGKVSLAFEIDKQGRPVNIEVRKSLCPSLDREAVRLLKSGPIWQGSAKVGQVDIWFK